MLFDAFIKTAISQKFSNPILMSYLSLRYVARGSTSFRIFAKASVLCAGSKHIPCHVIKRCTSVWSSSVSASLKFQAIKKKAPLIMISQQ
jgi:hypothetical protein